MVACAAHTARRSFEGTMVGFQIRATCIPWATLTSGQSCTSLQLETPNVG